MHSEYKPLISYSYVTDSCPHSETSSRFLDNASDSKHYEVLISYFHSNCFILHSHQQYALLLISLNPHQHLLLLVLSITAILMGI